ncbi:pirin family protein [Rhizobiales bacterium]|uniref:pirin family protein n=1 Tax=Hongsoonwoonella zoysiae TaxID=2821844 RepID=UPI00155F711C|nr:pirin family protein [Hongsoonwoonella zoysiae]NRG19298.1 pirin family protein [Hongsoonwoonella zoysiae]
MTWMPGNDPAPGDASACDVIDTLIVPRARDLGGFEVRRALPSAKQQMVGPFIFFDQMGPAEFLETGGIDVRPHPHIGLATVTYLFDGEIHHRDSLGSDQVIKPGELNWMTAGNGIVHSEREDAARKKTARKIFGIQSWVALPKHMEETAPAFEHHGLHALPVISDGGAEVRVIAGELYGARAPVSTASETIYADITLNAGGRMPIDATHEERAVYTVEGEITISGDKFGPGQLLVFKPDDTITVTADAPARFLLLGGEPMDGPRYIWWNFVSSSKERIDQAKEDWKRMRFDTVPGDTEDFIPLPEK